MCSERTRTKRGTARIELRNKQRNAALRSMILQQVATARFSGGTSREGSSSKPSGAADLFTARFFNDEGEHTLTVKRSADFIELKRQVAELWGYDGVEIIDVERRLRLNSDSELKLMVDEWKEREEARKQDVFTTWLLTIGQQLASEQPELGIHGLWELACRPENHAKVGDELLAQIVRVMSECAERSQGRVAAMAAGTLWMFAEADDTRSRIPASVIPALLDTAIKLAEHKGHSDLALQPIGALGCLLHEPSVPDVFDENGGTAALLPFLSSPSAQVPLPPLVHANCPARLSLPSPQQLWPLLL